MLLVLDNCEHVIDEAAHLAEALLRWSPGVRVLATSREPLLAEAEVVFRVSPLALPAEGTEDVDALLQAGAVRLFVTRARAADAHLSLDNQAGRAISAICKRLDGIPLAIELAAARAEALGLEALAARLEDRIEVLTGGWRTALPRHRTLRATLDWSYELLPDPERVVLRRISVFAGAFTLDAASAVATDVGITEADLVSCVANLASKSLLTADVSGSKAVYRLLKTTRSYVLEKLVKSGEFEVVARHHAKYCLSILEQTEAASTQPDERLAVFTRHVDDMRASLDWAFSLGDDAPLGVALTIASLPVWLHLSLTEELRERVTRALASVDRVSAIGARQETQLCDALDAAVTSWTSTVEFSSPPAV
jgi:predicted ATPase